MKEGEWYLLVFICTIALIIAFLTRNLVIAIGTFLVVMYLKRFAKDIKIPEAYKKFGIKSRFGEKDTGKK